MTTKNQPHLVPVTIESALAESPATAHIGIHIGVDEPLDHAMRRIMLSEFDVAINGVTHADDIDLGVHEARKALKRIRGLLRLVRDEIGYEVYRNENVVLRDIGRILAPVRDSNVLVHTFGDINERFGSALSPAASADINAFLRLNHRRLRASVVDDQQCMADLVVSLKSSRSRFVGHGTPSHPDQGAAVRDEFASIAGGLARVHRRGRRAMRRADEYRDTASLHEWRKRVKYLRYQTESLTSLWPELIGAYAHRLDDLGEVLGEEHDLAVLRSTLVERASTFPEAAIVVSALIDHLRVPLQERAFTLGRSIYTEPTNAFVSRMDSYWITARHTEG
jgi:CHAD domain-containing protein